MMLADDRMGDPKVTPKSVQHRAGADLERAFNALIVAAFEDIGESELGQRCKADPHEFRAEMEEGEKIAKLRLPKN